jgi:hypothetical protein
LLVGRSLHLKGGIHALLRQLDRYQMTSQRRQRVRLPASGCYRGVESIAEMQHQIRFERSVIRSRYIKNPLGVNRNRGACRTLLAPFGNKNDETARDFVQFADVRRPLALGDAICEFRCGYRIEGRSRRRAGVVDTECDIPGSKSRDVGSQLDRLGDFRLRIAPCGFRATSARTCTRPVEHPCGLCRYRQK